MRVIQKTDKGLQDKIAEARAEGQTVVVIGEEELVRGKGGVTAKSLPEALMLGALGVDPASGAMIVGGPKEPKTFDQLWMRDYSRAKVEPCDFFISCGPGSREDRYYGMVMRPATDEEIAEGQPEFIIVATERGAGHETDIKAKEAAALRYPTLPVLIGADYFYPAYESYMKETTKIEDRRIQILKDAEARRVRRGLTRQPNPPKAHYGKYFHKVGTYTKEEGPVLVQHTTKKKRKGEENEATPIDAD